MTPQNPSKIVLVTGASAGFGAAICRHFVRAGYRVIGAARRRARLDALHQELGDLFYPLVLDVCDMASCKNVLSTLPADLQNIDILVNNAGMALGQDPADQCAIEDWDIMVQTNVMGVLNLTQAVLPSMVKRNQGLIINMGSVAGNHPYPGSNVYGACKAFVKQFSQNLRADLWGKNIRVSNVEPGLCGETEFSEVRYRGDLKKVQDLYANVDYVTPDDIARTVLWIAEQPEHVNINRIEIMPTMQAFAGLKVFKP